MHTHLHTHVHRCPARLLDVHKEPTHLLLQAPNSPLGAANPPCSPSSRMCPPGAFPVMMCVPPALALGTPRAPHVATLRDWPCVSVDATMTQVAISHYWLHHLSLGLCVVAFDSLFVACFLIIRVPGCSSGVSYLCCWMHWVYKSLPQPVSDVYLWVLCQCLSSEVRKLNYGVTSSV